MYKTIKRFWQQHQATLDYFDTGVTIIFNSPSITSNFQDNRSPTLRSNCDINECGTVVRNDFELVVARVKTLSNPVKVSPKKDMVLKVFKITYPITHTFIYPENYIGNRIGN